MYWIAQDRSKFLGQVRLLDALPNNKEIIMETTKMTLTTVYGTATVEVNKTDLNMYDLIQEVIKPVLLASGYQPATVNEALGE